MDCVRLVCFAIPTFVFRVLLHICFVGCFLFCFSAVTNENVASSGYRKCLLKRPGSPSFVLVCFMF